MCCKRIENAVKLWCYKVTFEDKTIIFFVDTTMSDVATSANEYGIVKSIEEMGEGAIGC